MRRAVLDRQRAEAEDVVEQGDLLLGRLEHVHLLNLFLFPPLFAMFGGSRRRAGDIAGVHNGEPTKAATRNDRLPASATV